MHRNNLKLLQHNVQAWTFDRRNELYNYYREEDPDIILINSHGRREGEDIRLYNYTTYKKNYLNEMHDGVAIALKKDIKHKLIDNLEENYLGVTIETTQGEICIITGYQPPRRQHIPLQNLLQISRRNIPAYFLGDLNAAHRTLGHRRNNASGKLIYDLINNGSLTHHGPQFPTFITANSQGTPDIVLSNNRHIHNMHITQGKLTTSDHIPIIVKLSASPIQIPCAPRLDLKRANWEAFKAELGKVQRPELNNTPASNINKEMGIWFDKIAKAMEKNIPKTSHKILPHPNTTLAIQHIRQQYAIVQREAAQPTGWTRLLRQRHSLLKQQLQDICKRERNQYWEQMVSDIEKDYRNPSKFWKGVQRLLGSEAKSTPYIITDNGTRLFEEKAQEAEFRNYWKEIYKISDEENLDFCQETQTEVEKFLEDHKENWEPFDTIDMNRLEPNNTLTKKISKSEVFKTIKEFKNKKAPGISKISKEIICQLPDNMITIFTNILNASLSAGIFPDKFKKAILKFIPKKDKSTTKVQNHRPISLLEAAAKIYEKIINNRLREYQQTNELCNPNQHSYRRKRGTHTALALLYEEIAISQHDKEQCNIILRDVSKAFDKVYHKGLKMKIISMGLPRCFTAVLCNFLDDRTAAIQLGNYIGEEFQLHSGVPQGSCLSPTLYNLYVADLGQLNQCNYVQYADDITQIVRYQGASKNFCKLKTERAISEVNNFEKKWKIKTNQTKFKILHISKTKPKPIEINNTIIPYAQQATVLGLQINRTGIKPHVNTRIKLARAALARIKRFSHMTSKTKRHLYQAMVAPHLTYPPVPLNSISATQKAKMQAVQNSSLRWVNGDSPPYNTTTEDLHRKYEMKPVNIKLFEAAERVWETLRDTHPDEIHWIENVETRGTHSWWPRSYLEEGAIPPDPIYCNIRPNN